MDKIKASQFADLAYYARFQQSSLYQQVEYIEGTGTQYINTGIVPLASDYVFVDYQFTKTTDPDGTLFYIDNGASNNNAYGLSTAYVPGSTVGYICGWGTFTVSYNIALNTNRHTFGLCNGVFEYDGDPWVTKSGSLTLNKNILLPAWNRNGNAIFGGKVRIFEFAVFSSRNAQSPNIDLIPCYRKADSKPGMYDTVTNTFFTNSGTGEFTVGGNV